MNDISFIGVLNGALYAIAGLLLFAVVLGFAKTLLPAKDTGQAVIIAAGILGAAIIIASTMH